MNHSSPVNNTAITGNRMLMLIDYLLSLVEILDELYLGTLHTHVLAHVVPPRDSLIGRGGLEECIEEPITHFIF